MKTVNLAITEPKRLDVALAAALKVSRVQAQRLIKSGEVKMNGIEVTPHVIANNEDVITFDKKIEKKVKKEVVTVPILFENDDVIVVNKPAGLLVHPTATSKTWTVADTLLAHYPAIEGVGGDKTRSGIVHRLDKDASGVLIAAKNDRAHAFLKDQFKNRHAEKIYTVLVHDIVKDDAETINFPIARSKTRARMAARPTSQEGKEAITHFDVVTRYANATLLRVRIETGRTHQIRAHMFAFGHPVAGDTVYNRKDLKPFNFGRIFLHATQLTIPLPDGTTQTFSAPLPQELEEALTTLHKLS
ncbi:RluA family pseudouridine synthase [Patescibacteria group bacterium]|nr:RluA family pseudouridine synthase [Patescibacteria group bacterium]